MGSKIFQDTDFKPETTRHLKNILSHKFRIYRIPYLLVTFYVIKLAEKKSNKLLYNDWELFGESNLVQTDTSSA